MCGQAPVLPGGALDSQGGAIRREPVASTQAHASDSAGSRGCFRANVEGLLDSRHAQRGI